MSLILLVVSMKGIIKIDLNLCDFRKQSFFSENKNHSCMTIGTNLCFFPLIQKTMKIISSKYRGIRVNTLEVISKSLGGNLLLLRCLYVNYTF